MCLVCICYEPQLIGPHVVVSVARIAMAEEVKQPVAMKTSDVMVKALENENIE